MSANDIRELRRQTQAADKPAVSSEAIASAAKGLSYIRDAKLPVSDGTGVVAAAVRQGFRSHEVLDLGREIKRRERDFVAGRSTLSEVRDAITRGERPEQFFRDAARNASSVPRRRDRPDPSDPNDRRVPNGPRSQKRRSGRNDRSGRLRGRNNSHSQLKNANANKDCACSRTLKRAHYG